MHNLTSMFRADTQSSTQAPLYLVARPGPVTRMKPQGEQNMNTYKFANLPSNSSVDFGVTALISVWFLVAAGAILTDPSSIYTHRAPALQAKAAPATLVAIAPEARLTIHVVGRRSAPL
jgi:hypothetical protein